MLVVTFMCLENEYTCMYMAYVVLNKFWSFKHPLLTPTVALHFHSACSMAVMCMENLGLVKNDIPEAASRSWLFPSTETHCVL